MNRSRFDTLLAEFLDGSLSAGAAREFDAILGESAELRERLADAAEIHRLLEQELRSESGRAEGVNAVMRAVGRVAESRAGSDTAFEVMSKLRRGRRRDARATKRRAWLRYGIVTFGAAAATLLGSLVLRRPPEEAYPRPHVSGEVELVKGDLVARGTLVKARGEATLHLGGYVRVAMAPRAEVGLEGADDAEQVYLRAGGVVCDVDRGRGGRSFSVRTDAGTVSVKGTRFAVTILESHGGGKMKSKKMLVEVLLGAVVVSGAWGELALAGGQREVLPKGKIEAGRPRYASKGRAEAWKHKGRIVGVAKDAPKFEATAASASGRVTRAGVERLQTGDGVFELWLAPGVYSLRVEARGYEPLELKGLKVKTGHDLRIDLEFTEAAGGGKAAAPAEGETNLRWVAPPAKGDATAAEGRIESGKPRYVPKGRNGAWKNRGRIVGVAKNAPKFGAAAVSSSGRSTKAGVERTQTGDSVFELWLAPGVYSLRVEAGGYADLELQRLEVRAGHDLRIDLEFSR